MTTALLLTHPTSASPSASSRSPMARNAIRRRSGSAINGKRPPTIGAHARGIAGQSFTTAPMGHGRGSTGRHAGKFRRNPTNAFSPSRGGRVRHFSIFRVFRIPVFFSRETPVAVTFRRRRGFANRPLALRRAVLEVLDRRPWQTSAEIAGCVFSHGRILARPGWRRCSVSELSSTRRALRRLVAQGKVEVRHRRRCWKIFQLAESPR
jgi:hypothetical protein